MWEKMMGKAWERWERQRGNQPIDSLIHWKHLTQHEHPAMIAPPALSWETSDEHRSSHLVKPCWSEAVWLSYPTFQECKQYLPDERTDTLVTMGTAVSLRPVPTLCLGRIMLWEDRSPEVVFDSVLYCNISTKVFLSAPTPDRLSLRNSKAIWGKQSL